MACAPTSSTIAAAISSTGRTNSAPPFLDELAGHAPDDRGGFRLRDGSAALLVQQRHRIGAVASHPGHQHSHQLRCVIMLKRAGLPSVPRWDARDSRAAPGRAWRSCPPPAAPRSDRRRRGRYRSCPPATASDDSPRRPRSAHCRSSRLANGPVKLAGICCATRTGQGNPGGNCGRTMSSAAGPPVEVPISTSPCDRPALLLPTTRVAVAPGGAQRPRPEIDGEYARSAAKFGRMRALAAPRTFSTSSGRSRSISSETAPLGLATKSTAPSSMASSVASAPSSVSEEIITTGRGASIMIWPRQVSPSMPGIWTSSVTTCGIEGPDELKRFGAVAGQPDVEVAFRPKNSFEQFPHQRGIVGDEKLDHEAFDACSDRPDRTSPARQLRPDPGAVPDRPTRSFDLARPGLRRGRSGASAPPTAPAPDGSRRRAPS